MIDEKRCELCEHWDDDEDDREYCGRCGIVGDLMFAGSGTSCQVFRRRRTIADFRKHYPELCALVDDNPESNIFKRANVKLRAREQLYRLLGIKE